MKWQWIAGTAVVMAAGGAQAHVELEQPKAAAGALYKAAFMISHGCKGSPTTRVTVQIPEGVRTARPQPKPGWTLATRTQALAVPYELYGRKVTEEVTAVSWEGGPLANAHYDQFVVLVRLPDRAGPLYFKVMQECEQGRMDWVDVPAAGTAARKPDFPAPMLQIEPAPGGHAHHH